MEHRVPARPDTVFKIGSVSKQFIATGIMLLVQDGKLAVGDKVSKYLAGTPATWEAITLRHLLTHTSGLVREAPGFDPYKLQPDIDVIKTAYPVPLRFTPGEKSSTPTSATSSWRKSSTESADNRGATSSANECLLRWA